MTQGQKSLRGRLVDALIDSGTWMSPGELRAVYEGGMESVVEDTLADMVIEGDVDYRENVGYRLAGSLICRKAARLLRLEGKRVAVWGEAAKEGYVLGVAEQRAAFGVVMYEMALPAAGEDQDALQVQLEQVGAVVNFVNSRGGCDGGTGV